MSTKSTTHGNGHTSHASHTTEAAAAPEPAAAPVKASSKHVPQKPPAEIAASPAPTTDQVTAMIQQLDAMASQFGVGAAPLTIEDRRKLLKIRPGGETHATKVMALADRYGLAIPGVSSADVAAHVKVAQDLGPFIERLQSMLGLATDVSLGSQSRVWRSATKAYSMLTRLVPEYPALQKELTPMASLLAVKYKDAPTSLRAQEKKTLAKSRGTRKSKKAAANAAPVAEEAAPVAAAASPTPAAVMLPAPEKVAAP